MNSWYVHPLQFITMSNRYMNLTKSMLFIVIPKITQQGKNSKNIEEEEGIVLEALVLVQ